MFKKGSLILLIFFSQVSVSFSTECRAIINSKLLPVNDNLKIKESFVFLKNDSLRLFRKEKAVASLFAFPLPFGFVGAHRVVLGTKPWVPVVYAATLGGGFGLLPLIDFFVILFYKEKDKYNNNPNLFMWVQ